MKKKLAQKPIFKTDDFNPWIWERLDQSESIRFLVCDKRCEHTPFTDNGQGGKVVDRIIHRVVIIIGTPSIVRYDGMTIESGEWKRSEPQAYGIKRREAQTALAEAWRGVEGITSPSWPATHHRFQCKAPFLVPNDLNAAPQEKTALRNINAWLNWSRWEKQELTRKERAQELSKMGIPTTEGQLGKAAENAGF